MKQKNPNHSMKKKDGAKKGTSYYDIYRDLFDLRRRPVTERFIEKLALDLMNWAEKDEKALKITQFINSKRIGKKDYYRWKKKYPNLGLAHDFALSVIGDRREIGGLERKYSERLVMFTLPNYDKEFKDLVVWNAELNEKKQSNEKTVVVIKEMPSSDLVPERNTKKNQHED